MSLRKISHAALGAFLFVFVSSGVLALVWTFQLAAEIRTQLDAVDVIGKDDLALTSEIFDRRGEKIGELGAERRYFVTLKSLPAHVPQAFVSAEDKGFRDHHGISPMAIMRAVIANLRGQRLSQGASTITQQVARLFFLDPAKSWERKAKEAILALVIERRLTKDQILELYLNRIYLGNRSYGIEAASRNYFRKGAADLSVGEAALLAGLPKSPSSYAPNKNPKRASERQAFVLRRLEEDGFLAVGDAAAWAKRVVHVSAGPEDHWSKAPYFIVAARKELGRKLELQESASMKGLRIFTTLDSRLQKAADFAVTATIKKARRGAVHEGVEHGKIEGAVFSLDPRTGAVLASTGGSSFAKSQFDRSRLARRRLGGLMVPIYVSLALERGYSLASRVGDDPMGGRKLNEQSGDPTIYDAVVKAMTYEAAPLYTALGAGSVMEHVKRLGLEFANAGISNAFGLGESSPKEVARAYSTFVNGGHLVDPYLIERVEDGNGKVLYQAQHTLPAEQVLTPQASYITYNLLQESIRGGHANVAKGVSPLAGGMAVATDDLHDAWFAGVLPNVVSAVWIGAETGRTRLAATADDVAALPAQAWLEFMKATTFAKVAEPLLAPEGISFARIPGGAQRSLPFLAGTEPTSGTRRF